MVLLTGKIAKGKSTILREYSLQGGAETENMHRRDRENLKRRRQEREAGICEVQQQSQWDRTAPSSITSHFTLNSSHLAAKTSRGNTRKHNAHFNMKTLDMLCSSCNPPPLHTSLFSSCSRNEIITSCSSVWRFSQTQGALGGMCAWETVTYPYGQWFSVGYSFSMKAPTCQTHIQQK